MEAPSCAVEVLARWPSSQRRLPSFKRWPAVATDDFWNFRFPLQAPEAESKCQVCRARCEQAEAEKRSRQAQGTLEAETELARREKELADTEAALTLLKAGSRPEKIEAEKARVARLEEDIRYLEELQEKLVVLSPVPGVVTTPRLREKCGQYVREGEIIGVVEVPYVFEVEITLVEEDFSRVEVGQTVRMKARSLPFETLQARVDRIAPAAASGDARSTVTVYCRIECTGKELESGMTGHARITTLRRPIGAILFDRAYRLLRTEFWW